MQSKELREKFIKFFVERGHKLMPPSSLIPENDPSVLFTTAGMQQFKRFYTNPKEAPAKNVVTCQPCLRTSDIDLVGDETHLTFFEMLGNFSFGGYFKKEAIEWAYEFLAKVLNIDSDRMMCSIFSGDEKNPRDDESAEILADMSVKYEEHDRYDNFWGPTGSEGPCGPTVEFYVDGVEVWNLVFNEYYKNSDGSYKKLETLGIDTGMGLERMLVVVNKAENVFHTDIFDLEHKKLHELLTTENPVAERIILDHIKASCFVLNNKVLPSNKDRGYIVRRLIRRAIVKAKKIGIEQNFTDKLLEPINKTYQNYGIEVEVITNELKKEEEKFRKVLSQGIKEFNKIKNNLDGEKAFNLYQSYGFPIEITEEMAKEAGIKIDEKEFEKAFNQHQEISRAGVSGFKSGLVGETEITTRMHTANHLLLKALQEVLGPDVHQRGSNINEERIRFDFSYPKPMTEEEVKKTENIVNEKIAEDLPVVKKETTVEEAKKLGAEAQFLNKYSMYDKLTMYSIGDPSTGSGQAYSNELCGGPHVKSTGGIGKFKIIKEESSSAGVRRIRAVLE